MLSKLKIIAYSAPENLSDLVDQFSASLSAILGSKLTEFEAYYNPESIQVTLGQSTKTSTGINVPSIVQTMVDGPKTYSFKLVIDGTGVSGPKVSSVKAEVERFMALGRIQHGKGVAQVPFLEVIWGDFYLQCLLKSATVSYTLFSPEGRALRASIDCTFEEFVLQQEKAATTVDSTDSLLKGGMVQTAAEFAARTGLPLGAVVDMARKNGADSLRNINSAGAMFS